MASRIIKVCFLIFWMILIFYFSMDTGVESTAKSDGFIIRTTEMILRRKLTSEEKQQYIDNYQIYVRKTAHVMVYFFLGLSFIFLLQDFHPIQKRDVILTILFVFLYACSDEFHQLFVQERAGQFRDVLLDTFGGILASFFFYQIYLIRKKKQN